MKYLLLLAFASLFVLSGHSQNVGIGTPTPRFPLSFGPTLGQKISLWEDGNPSGANYGFGIQAGLFQIHAYSITDNIVFGFGSSANFTERLRITGSGNLGIKTSTISPTAWGTPGNHSIVEIHNPSTTSGTQSMLVLSNNASNSRVGGITWAVTNIDPENRIAYMGVNWESDGGGKMIFSTKNGTNALVERATINSKGLFRIEGPQLAAQGNGFSMGGFGHFGVDAPGVVNGRFMVSENGLVGINKANPTARLDVNGDMNVSGALKIANSEGVAGQQLVSRGAGQAPAWVNRPYVLYYNRTGNVELTGSTLCADVPGISGQVFTLSTAASLTYQFTISLFADNGILGAESRAGLVIQIRNSSGVMVSQGASQIAVKNLLSENFHVVGVGDLPPGTYSIVARLIRSASNQGTVLLNYGVFGSTPDCNDVSIVSGQLMMQVFPK